MKLLRERVFQELTTISIEQPHWHRHWVRGQLFVPDGNDLPPGCAYTNHDRTTATHCLLMYLVHAAYSEVNRDLSSTTKITQFARLCMLTTHQA